MTMLLKKNHCQPNSSRPVQRVLGPDSDENRQIWVKCLAEIPDIILNQKPRKRKLIHNIHCSKHFVKNKLPNCFFKSLILLQGIFKVGIDIGSIDCITGVIIWSIVWEFSRIRLEFLIFRTQRRRWIRKNIRVMYKIVNWNEMVTRQQVGLEWDVIFAWWIPIRVKCAMKVISPNFYCGNITWWNKSFKFIR